MTGPDLSLRRATAEDLPAVATLHLRAREAALGAMPPLPHPPEDVRAWFASWDLDAREVWLAEHPGASRPAGYLALTPTWLDDLYVDPAWWRAGVGAALLDLALARRPDGLSLWVFETNAPARALYAPRGFVELEHTDGSANMERSPDVRLAWPGSDPLAFWRSLIDDVDADLGDLLARRAALTAAVQRHRGRAARDAERERRVAAAVAARVPALGHERVARIVDAIITESLAAAAEQGSDER